MTADTRTTDRPARLAAHELVLLHGQPGSPADWQPVTARLPAQLHAIAADRPGYGSEITTRNLQSDASDLLLSAPHGAATPRALHALPGG